MPGGWERSWPPDLFLADEVHVIVSGVVGTIVISIAGKLPPRIHHPRRPRASSVLAEIHEATENCFMSEVKTRRPICGDALIRCGEEIRDIIYVLLADTIRNGNEARAFFYSIQQFMAGGVPNVPDDTLDSVTNRLGSLLSTWDMHHRDDQDYWTAIQEACSTLRGFLVALDTVQVGVIEAALMAICLAADRRAGPARLAHD